MTHLLTYIKWPFILYAAYCILAFGLQRRMMYPRHLVETPPSRDTRDGVVMHLPLGSASVEAWFVPPASSEAAGPSPAVIFAHGNAELIDDWFDPLIEFRRLGVGLLLVEYPGYGRSGGAPSQKNITRVFTAAYDRLCARADVDPARIVFMGRSLGGGAVCALSRHRPCAALILMSTFTGARTFAKRFLLPPFLIRDPYDNLAALRAYPGPVFILHGRWDNLIPFRHGAVLERAARNGRLMACDAGHNDCPPDWDAFWREIKGFLCSAGILE